MATTYKKVSFLLASVDHHCTSKISTSNRISLYQATTFIITFLTYMLYHANRKVIGVVKQVWNENCTAAFPNESMHYNTSTWCDWPPFNGEDAQELLGTMDMCFLSSYAVFMFVSGYIAERSNLRLYLSTGMLLTGLFNVMLGLGYWIDQHSFAYFLVFNILAGASQATGWPAVVALMGNWFGRSRRGFIMGAWNVHTSVGNMFGSFIAGLFVQSNWGLSFAVPALIIMTFAFVVFLAVAPHPSDVGLQDPNTPQSQPALHHAEEQEEQQRLLGDYSEVDEASGGSTVTKRAVAGDTEVSECSTSTMASTAQLVDVNSISSNRAVSFWTAIMIPGVITFSLSLFFIKFVNYVFMFWLPKYIHSNSSFDARESANMSMLFDAGGIIGGVVAGALSDRFKKPATICFCMLTLSIPMMFVYNAYGLANLAVSDSLLLLTGFFVNAPYALITTAVSAELGQHSTLQNSAKALATVSAVIDGTGSVGAALGPFMTGIVADHFGWEQVFIMLMISSGFGLVCLAVQAYKEIRRHNVVVEIASRT
ncbi:Major facilitator superfamily [Trinorchestia longiramus]|nr:Major facilitator superfamily [Trinorchestia longiramus]